MTTKTVTLPYKPRELAKQIHECPARFITVVAHRRFGKSHILFNEGQKRALKKKGRYGIIGPYANQVRSIYEKGGIVNKYRPFAYSRFNTNDMTVRYANGSIFELIGSENYDAHRGTQYDWLGFDESDDHRPEAWDQVFRYTIMAQNDGSFGGGDVMFVGTLKGEGFLWRQMNMKGDDRKSFLFKASETNILTNEDIEMIREECKGDESVMLQELECIPMHYSGLVLKNFGSDNIIEPFDVPFEWHRFESIDVGSVHPTAILHAAEDKEGTIYIYSEHLEQYMSAKKIAQTVMMKRYSSKGVYIKPKHTVIDTSAGKIDQSSGTSIRVQLEEEKIDTIGANKDVQGSVMKLNSMFKDKKILIFNDCVNLISQCKNVRWEEPRTMNGVTIAREGIVKHDDDLFDTLRYLVMSRPDYYGYEKPKVHATPQQILRAEMQRINYTQEKNDTISDAFYLS